MSIKLIASDLDGTLLTDKKPGICGCSDCRETKRKNCHGGGY